MTLHALFLDSASKHPDKRCILYADLDQTEAYTYGEIKESVISLRKEFPTFGKCFCILYLSLTSSTPVVILSSLLSSNPFYFADPDEASFSDVIKIASKLKAGLLLTNVNMPQEAHGVWEKLKTIVLFQDNIYFWKTGNDEEDSGKYAYAIETSGSLGVPKLVRVPHDSIVPNILDLRELLKLDSSDVIALSSPLTFDPSIVEIFLAFSSGAALCIVSKKLKNSNFFNTLQKLQVTLLQTTPSLFKKYNTSNFDSKNSSLKNLVLGGENFPDWKEIHNWDIIKSEKVKIFNVYGITEVSCWASVRQVWPQLDKQSVDQIDIGSPLGNTIFKLENVEGNIGELYLGSHKRICVIDEESEEIFSKGPVFRATGDLFKEIDGKYYFICRKNDSCFKRFGLKVDALLVEKISKDFPIETCAVWTHVDSEPILGLFVKSDPQVFTSFDNWLKSEKKVDFPKGHWPDFILHLDELPLSKHGKVNKSKLKEILKQRHTDVTYSNDNFKNLWMHFTGCLTLSEQSTFTESGGDSITAIQFSSILGSDSILGLLLGGSTYSECITYLASNSNSLQGAKRQLTDNSQDIRIKHVQFDAIMILKGRIWPETKLFNKTFNENKLEISWKHDLKKCIDSSPLGIVFKSGQELVIVASHSGIVKVINVSGQIISETVLPDRVESSACLSSDMNSFFIGCYDGCVYRIELSTGNILCKFKTDDMVKSTCLSYRGKIYFGSYDKHFYSIHENCHLNWKTFLNSSILSEVLIWDNMLFVCGTSGGVWSLDLKGQIEWFIETKPIFANPAIVNRHLVVAPVVGGIDYIELKSGHKAHHVDIGGYVFSSPVILDSKILIIADSTFYIIEDHEILWSIQLSSRAVSSSSILDETKNEVLVVSTDGSINLISLLNKNSTVIYNLNKEVFSTPVIFPSGHIVLGSRDNHVYCFKLVQ